MAGRLLRSGDLSGRQRYRLLTSLVLPRPIGWIGTRGGSGRANLAPFSYFNGVSASPMLVSASIGRRRRASGGSSESKDTLRNLRETAAFSVNVVTERHLEAMVRTAGEWAPDVDEFEDAELVAAECETVEAPYVSDAPAVLECRLFRVVDLGDAPNTLVIGEVLGIRLGGSLRIDPETLHVDVESLRPVGRLGMDEYTLLGEVRRVARPRAEGSDGG